MVPFSRQEIVIAAAVTVARIVPARRGARLIDGAPALFGVEETADAAEIFVGLAPQGVLLAGIFLGEFCACFFEAEVKVLGQTLDVPFGHRYQWIGTSITGALGTIVRDGHGDTQIRDRARQFIGTQGRREVKLGVKGGANLRLGYNAAST